MGIKRFVAIAMIDYYAVSVSAPVRPAGNDYPPAISRQNCRGRAVGYINSSVIPDKSLGNGSCCRPDKLPRGNDRPGVGSNLANTGGRLNGGRPNSVRNNNVLPYGEFKSFIITESIK